MLIYNLITCLYLCLKVENRISWSFEMFYDQVIQLRSYMDLHRHLTPLGPLEWTAELYPMLEKEILGNALKFKT